MSYLTKPGRLGALLISMAALHNTAMAAEKVEATPPTSSSVEQAAVAATPAAQPEAFPKKDSPEAAVIRGESVFKRYCILCHGVEGDGKGRAAKNYDPKPTDLRQSDKNTLYKVMIVTRGGQAMGRSNFMPPWGEELTSEQISDVATYLDSIVKKDAVKP